METNFTDDLNTIRADDYVLANEELADMEENDFCDDVERDYQYEKALDYTEEPEGFENLETPEEVAEFEAWLDEIDRAYDESMDGDHESALESVYGPND